MAFRIYQKQKKRNWKHRRFAHRKIARFAKSHRSTASSNENVTLLSDVALTTPRPAHVLALVNVNNICMVLYDSLLSLNRTPEPESPDGCHRTAHSADVTGPIAQCARAM